MSTTHPCFNHFSDRDLLREVTRLAACERNATVTLIASLAELDRRRLYLAEGCSSLFTYCTSVLHLSEHAAYGRIEAARAARRFPVIVDLLAEGAVTLTTITLLARHLTNENHVALLTEARHRRKRDVQQIVARIQPQPDAPSTVRRLPTPTPPRREAITADASRAGSSDRAGRSPQVLLALESARVEPATTRAPTPPHEPPARTAEVRPLAPTRYKVSFTISVETYTKLQQAQDLLRHVIPNGDPALLFDRALTLLLAECVRTKLAATDKPRTSSLKERVSTARSRHIPAAVRRQVWRRDGGQCAFVSANGRRCAERGFLEFHHVVPYAKGGKASVENTEVRCRAHNVYEAACELGSWPRTCVRETQPTFEHEIHTTRSGPSSACLLRASPSHVFANTRYADRQESRLTWQAQEQAVQAPGRRPCPLR